MSPEVSVEAGAVRISRRAGSRVKAIRHTDSHDNRPQVLTTPVLAARRYRFSASLIDGLIFSIVLSPVYSLFYDDLEMADESISVSYLNPYAGNPYWPVDVAISGLFAVYFWLQHAFWGQTPGKRLYRLKVVSRTTGESPDLRQAGVRALVYPAVMLVPYAGVLINLVDTLCIFFGWKRRCLHDVIADTVVIDLSDPGRRGIGFLFGLGVVLVLTTVFLLVYVMPG
ncbi:RDD family protein [Streptosporangium lutulentum]